MGLLDPVTDLLMGSTPSASKSGAFPGGEDIKKLGSSYLDYLYERLTTPATQTKQYALGSTALSEAVGNYGNAARQRLGDTAAARGYLDSGAVFDMLGGIDRAEIQSFAEGIRNLILELEDRRDANLLPYLSAAAGENANIQGINVQSQTARDSLLNSLIGGVMSNAAGAAGAASIFAF